MKTITQPQVHPLILERKSVRAFADKPVTEETMQQLFSAARWAPSAFNEQPWHYVYARREDAAAFENILQTLLPGNQSWAKNAGSLIITVAKTFLALNQNHNKHAWHDVGAANALLSLQAAALGLSVHQMGGFSPEKAMVAANIPAGYEPVTVMAVGYPADASQLPDNLREREAAPRQRQPVEAFAFAHSWPTTI